MALTAAEIRRQILKKERLYPKKGGGLTSRIPASSPEKTTLMRYIEDRFGVPVEQLVWDGSLDAVADKLDIDRVTVLRWRRKLSAMAA